MADYSNICDLYDKHLGAVLFEPYAKDLAKHIAGKVSEGAILEMACGTGILTELLRTHLNDDIALTATDISQSMLDYAQGKLDKLENVEWHRADMANLPFKDETFTAAVCQFGLMFVENKHQAFKEIHRVLTQGGTLTFSVWDSLENNPPIQIAHEIVEKLFVENPPQFFKEPYAYHDIDAIKEVLMSSGFENIEIEILQLEACSDSVDSFAVGLIEGSPILDEIQERGTTTSTKFIIDKLSTALHQHGGSPFSSTTQAIIVTAQAK